MLLGSYISSELVNRSDYQARQRIGWNLSWACRRIRPLQNNFFTPSQSRWGENTPHPHPPPQGDMSWNPAKLTHYGRAPEDAVHRSLHFCDFVGLQPKRWAIGFSLSSEAAPQTDKEQAMITARSRVYSWLMKYFQHFKSPSFPPFLKGEEGGFILSSNLTHLLSF